MKFYCTVRIVNFFWTPELSADSQGPGSAAELFCWEQDLKAPALLHMENGTGAAFALHFFLLRWHKPSFTKDKHKCVCEHSRVRVTQTHADKHKSVFLRAQMLCLRMNYLVSCWLRSYCNKRPGPGAHLTPHPPHTETHHNSTPVCCHIPCTHPAALGCPVRDHAEISWVFRIQEKEKKNYSLLLKIAFQYISHGSQFYSHIPSDTESAPQVWLWCFCCS